MGQIIDVELIGDEFDNTIEVVNRDVEINFIANCDNLYDDCYIDEVINCLMPSIVYEDEFFPQQEFLRNRYIIQCLIPEQNSPGGDYELQMKIPGYLGVQYVDSSAQTQFMSSVSAPEDDWAIIDGANMPASQYLASDSTDGVANAHARVASFSN